MRRELEALRQEVAALRRLPAPSPADAPTTETASPSPATDEDPHGLRHLVDALRHPSTH